jgi:hypothetical protein
LLVFWSASDIFSGRPERVEARRNRHRRNLDHLLAHVGWREEARFQVRLNGWPPTIASRCQAWSERRRERIGEPEKVQCRRDGAFIHGNQANRAVRDISALAKAMFETSAEVLGGLIRAVRDCEQKKESAWRWETRAFKSRESKNAEAYVPLLQPTRQKICFGSCLFHFRHVLHHIPAAPIV